MVNQSSRLTTPIEQDTLPQFYGGTMKRCDVIVVGGGMVGAAVALGLAKLGQKVAVLEKNPLPTFSPDEPYDLRISAISAASVALLTELGVWQSVLAMRAHPYDRLQTWEIDGFDVSFSATDLGLTELGFMVENNVLQLALWQALENSSNSVHVVGFRQIVAKRVDDIWQVSADERTFTAPLIIACDGANSVARGWANIGLSGWQYRQHCLLALVKTALPAQNVTWQQFYPSGPRAFLPLAEQNGCVVWYDSPKRVAELSRLSPVKLRAEIADHFPAKLGEVDVVCHGAFPLARQHAQHYFRNGVVLVGDAAHTINPLAGQGVNLGFKDVKVLLALAEQAQQQGECLADECWLKRYEQQRRPDNLLMQTGMDLFYKVFKSEPLPFKIVRNLAFLAAQRATFFKKRVLKYALGLL